MAISITILKNDGIFLYSEYQPNKVARRMAELETDLVHPVARSYGGPIVGYLLSTTHYANLLAAFIGVLPAINEELITDDYLGTNFSQLLDLVQGYAQVTSLIPKIAAQGTTAAAYKNYTVEQDTAYSLIGGGVAEKGGRDLAVLIHPDIYTLIA